MKKILPSLLLFLITHVAFAQNIYYVDVQKLDNTNSGLSWSNAFKDLQHAIDQTTVNDEIWVKTGIYLPTETPSPADAGAKEKTFHISHDVKIYGGFNGTETERDQRDWHLNLTTLSGDISQNDSIVGTAENIEFYHSSDNVYHVITTANLSNAAIIDGFIITSGHAKGEGDFTFETYDYNHDTGAGLTNYSSSPTLKNCIFEHNRATYGGAIYNTEESHSVYDSCTFQHNYAYDFSSKEQSISEINMDSDADVEANALAYGGAFYNNRDSEPYLENSIFRYNYAVTKATTSSYALSDINTGSSAQDIEATAYSEASVSSKGGAFYNYFGSSPVFENVTFEYNQAISKANTSAEAVVQAHSLADGESDSFDESYGTSIGGAVFSRVGGNPEFNNCLFSENSAICELISNTISTAPLHNNSNSQPYSESESGAEAFGGACYFESTSVPLFTNSIFYKNLAKANTDSDAQSSGAGAFNSAITEANSDAYGGAIFINSTSIEYAKFRNVLFSNNTTDTDASAHSNGKLSIFEDADAISNGGAIWSYNARTDFSNVTLVNNECLANSVADINSSDFTEDLEIATGGGVTIGGGSSKTNILNSIIWDNMGDTLPNIEVNSNQIDSMAYSIMQGSGGSIAWNFPQAIDGGFNLDTLPGFKNLALPMGADNVFFTSDDGLSLMYGSPAIDKGDSSMIDYATDILGNSHFGLTDIGAYEYFCEAPASLNITQDINGVNAIHEATEFITANNTLSPTAQISYNAGKSILLTPGFEVNNGVVFKATVINPCGSN